MHLPDLKIDTSLSEAVYRAIRKEIASGRLKAGQKITESEISLAMGISRAPVREAFKRLAMDHLVNLIPRSGCYVADLDEKEIEEIFEIRKRLECMALEYAFANFSAHRLRDLRNRFESCKTMASREAVEKEIKLDGYLHDLIAIKSGCDNLKEMLKALWSRIEIIRLREAERGYVPVDAAKEHIALLDSLIDGDKDRAVDLLARHIENSKKTVISHYYCQKQE
ncbi:MAG: FCD domain-containing protein [Chitinivibrionales bacterium]|nr:FCD domain-containing protein [Chitinivibrionales bacterium]